MKNKIIFLLLSIFFIEINSLNSRKLHAKNFISESIVEMPENIEAEIYDEIKTFLKSNKSEQNKSKDKLKKLLKEHLKLLKKQKINLDEFKYTNILDTDNDYYLTLMQFTALIGDIDSVIDLLASGVDPKKANRKFNTPLHYTTDVEIAELLISQNINIDAKNYLGNTPLHKAAKYGNFEVVQILVQNKAKINELSYTDRTPLHLSIETNNNIISEFLINNGTNINSNTNSLKYTPLHTAIIAFNVNIIKLLLEKSADPNLKDIYGNTPLDLLNKLDKLKDAI
ncbi:MAG: ankyrin repeat domain-containing protein [bacterium]